MYSIIDRLYAMLHNSQIISYLTSGVDLFSEGMLSNDVVAKQLVKPPIMLFRM